MAQLKIRVEVPATVGLTKDQVASLKTVMRTHLASVRSGEQKEDLSSIPETNIIIGKPPARKPTTAKSKKTSKKK